MKRPTTFILIFLLIIQAYSHFRLVYPTARNQESGIKDYPCGSDSFFGSGQNITILKPGITTIRWEETISHAGAPFRIAISIEDDLKYDQFILVDHIPHNDQGSASFESPKPYEFNITIPNINW